MTVDDPTLETRLENLLESTEGIREAIATENTKRDLAIRSNRRVLRGVILSVAVMIAAIVITVAYAVRSSDDLHAFRSSTTTARIFSCKQDVAKAKLQIRAEKAEIRKTIGALAAQSHDPNIAARVHAFYVDYDRTVEAEHPLRDCTPAGIAAYLGIDAPA